ncbi:MAG: hypothetical protein ACR2QO_17720, partial [Acidimicrobiales bacterium]
EFDEGDVTAEIGLNTVERATVRDHDLHDASTKTQPLAIVIERTGVVGEPGRYERELTCDVYRVDLDVQQDWWRTGHGGQIEAIMEMPDHLIAEIDVVVGATRGARATTPIVSGSWGALGQS